jgi:hypothetical protein
VEAAAAPMVALAGVGGESHRRNGIGCSPSFSRAPAASRRKLSKPALQTRKRTETVAPPPVPSPVRMPSERVDAPPSSGLVVLPFAAEPDEENAQWRDFRCRRCSTRAMRGPLPTQRQIVAVRWLAGDP